MIIPAYLKKGDTIRIVAPAGKIKKELVMNGVEWLERQGFQVVVGDHVFDTFNQFAGKDEDRLKDLQAALDDPEADAIICIRGGYGTARIIDKPDFSKFLENPKWVVGFSDITVLHNRLNRLGIASIHGAMVRHLVDKNGKTPEEAKSLFSLLEGGKPTYGAGQNDLNRHGVATAELVGGNLAIIYSLRGTPYDLETDGKILFIEDTGEYLYHTDRMMQNLKLGGKLKNLAGLVVGEFSRMKDNRSAFGRNVYEIIADAVKEYTYPVCFGFPAGHGRRNVAFTFGRRWNLEVAESGSDLSLL